MGVDGSRDVKIILLLKSILKYKKNYFFRLSNLQVMDSKVHHFRNCKYW